jgi:integrase
MVRLLRGLTDKRVRAEKKRGFYADGGGLYLAVAKGGTKTWVFRYKQNGRTHDMGLGSIHDRTLADAREEATKQRRLRLDGIDPLQHRRDRQQEQQIETAKAITFDQCAAAYIDANSAAWRSARHRAQWRETLATYVSPVFGNLPVQAIDTALVLKVLEPIWKTKPETASRVRGRIEAVLSYAKARGQRSGENPAQWAGHLKSILPSPAKLKAVKHHDAIPWDEIAPFMGDLRDVDGPAARALEFVVLTATRTNETVGAEWPEIDLDAAGGPVWEIPASRMKSGRAHRVPLSAAAVASLKRLPRTGKLVFATSKGGKLLPGTLWRVLRATGRDFAVHGFRSTFADWAYAQTNFPREIVEAALAHTVGDKTERAYRRGDALERRRRLMGAWAEHCSRPAAPKGKVISIAATR